MASIAKPLPPTWTSFISKRLEVARWTVTRSVPDQHPVQHQDIATQPFYRVVEGGRSKDPALEPKWPPSAGSNQTTTMLMPMSLLQYLYLHDNGFYRKTPTTHLDIFYFKTVGSGMLDCYQICSRSAPSPTSGHCQLPQSTKVRSPGCCKRLVVGRVVWFWVPMN